MFNQKLIELSKKSNFNIMEQINDPDVQIEYFEYIINKRKIKDEKLIISQKNDLFEKETTIAQKKTLLANLAAIPEVEVYRAIEKYSKKPDKELKDWATLALQENNMLLKGTLLEENQILVSTGLGGRGKKLRYFVVLRSHENKELTDLQKKILTKEITFYGNRYDCEIEKIKHGVFFTSILILLDIEDSIESIFRKIVEQTNELGNFLSTDIVISTHKEFDEKEILKILKQHNNRIQNQ